VVVIKQSIMIMFYLSISDLFIILSIITIFIFFRVVFTVNSLEKVSVVIIASITFLCLLFYLILFPGLLFL